MIFSVTATAAERITLDNIVRAESAFRDSVQRFSNPGMSLPWMLTHLELSAL